MENCKDFFIEFKFVLICKNIRVRLVKYTCSLFIELTLGWFSKKLQAERFLTLSNPQVGLIRFLKLTVHCAPIIWAVNDL